MTPSTAATVRADMAHNSPNEVDEQAAGHRDGLRVLSYLLSGPLCYGGIGWLIDNFVLDRVLLLPIGIVVGLALSIFMIIRRYGRTS